MRWLNITSYHPVVILWVVGFMFRMSWVMAWLNVVFNKSPAVLLWCFLLGMAIGRFHRLERAIERILK